MVPNGQRPRLFRPLDKHRLAHPFQLKGFPGLRSPATWPEMWEKRREKKYQCSVLDIYKTNGTVAIST